MKKIIIPMLAVIFMAASCDKNQSVTPENLDYTPQKKVGVVIQKQQGWQGFSTNIEMQNMDAAAFMEQHPKILIMKTIDKVCWNVDGNIINQIGDLDCLSGYLCYFTDDCELTLEGEYTSATMPTEMPLSWSQWGCPYLYPNYPNTAYPMPQPASPTDIIKQIPTGEVFWEYYNINTIGLLEPYSAYLVHIECSDGVTPAMLEEYNGINRIVHKSTKDGTCGIMIQPSYLDLNGNICDEEDAVAYLDEELGVVWL